MRTALIAGGGIGGLAAGIALRRAGWRVRIFERAATPREVGFALNLAANAMAALAELGVADRVLGGGHRTMHAEIRTGSGRRLKRVDLPSAIRGARAIVATRPVLHGALLDAIGPEPLVVDSEVVGFETTDTGVTLILAGGARESGDVLIGADGVKSVIRHVLHPDEPPPSASGYCALRGVTGDVTERMGDVSAVTYLGRGIEASIARAGMGALSWYMSLLAREVPSGTSPPVVAERFLNRLDGTFRAVVRATQPEDMRFDVLYEREPLESWGRGVVTLLGDAAHPMLPHTGQGAAQALEDAVALGLVHCRPRCRRAGGAAPLRARTGRANEAADRARPPRGEGHDDAQRPDDAGSDGVDPDRARDSHGADVHDGRRGRPPPGASMSDGPAPACSQAFFDTFAVTIPAATTVGDVDAVVRRAPPDQYPRLLDIGLRYLLLSQAGLRVERRLVWWREEHEPGPGHARHRLVCVRP